MWLKAALEDGQKAQDSAFFKCGAQQCFPYRGYVTYIWTITRYMRMSDVAVWSIRTPFRQSSGPCVLGLNSIQSIWSWTSAPWSLSRHSLSQSSVSSKPAIIWYILWRNISVWLCTTMGFRRGSLIQDSMRSMAVWSLFIFADKGQSAERGELECGEIHCHSRTVHGLKFKQLRKSLVIRGIWGNFAHEVKEKCFLFLALQKYHLILWLPNNYEDSFTFFMNNSGYISKNRQITKYIMNNSDNAIQIGLTSIERGNFYKVRPDLEGCFGAHVVRDNDSKLCGLVTDNGEEIMPCILTMCLSYHLHSSKPVSRGNTINLWYCPTVIGPILRCLELILFR